MTDDHVRVTGTAQRSVAPDRASWRAEAVESGENARAAFERCSARLNALTERLAAVGDVVTEAVVVQPEWDEDAGRGPARVEAVGGVRVRSDAARAGEVAQAAMAAGADRLHGPQFLYEAWHEARTDLLAEAVADARRKAERLAAAAGRRLDRVRSVEETDDLHPVADVALASGLRVVPRDQTITARVTVVFAFED